MFVVGVAFLCLVIFVGAAGFTTPTSWLKEQKPENKCLGYTIIAFDKGIDCYGDTIRLVRRNGFAERATDAD